MVLKVKKSEPIISLTNVRDGYDVVENTVETSFAMNSTIDTNTTKLTKKQKRALRKKDKENNN